MLFTKENRIKMIPVPSRSFCTGMRVSPVSKGSFASCIPWFIKSAFISSGFGEEESLLEVCTSVVESRD